jgi:PPOX class probable F420-dependent enzyme
MTSRRNDIRMTDGELAALLETEMYGVLATLGVDGSPHLTSIIYQWLPPDEIVMLAFRKAQKTVNLRRDPRCSFLVERTHPYSEIRGALLQGVAHVDDDLETVKSLQRQIMSASIERDGADSLPPVDVDAVAPKRVVLRMHVERTATWDHRKLGGIY